ncbi:MAG: GNAT family N-acetyltransferase [Proteobacteria bacterium]|nr:GNAT family N-acetyltransferase [Pseudomonadota bacterium]
MRHALWCEASVAEHGEEICALIDRPDAGFLALIARTPDGAAVGFAEAAIRHEYVNGCDSSPVGFLEGIFVEDACRRAGLATRLCRAVEDWVRRMGCAELASDTDWENPEGIAFHAGFGFEETERVIFFRKHLI